MKRLSILLFTVIISCFTITANAQIKFGVKGALNFNDHKTKAITLRNSTSWQAGIMARFNLPIIGLGVQPEVLYIHRSSENAQGESLHNSYLQIPFNAIWTFGLGNIGLFVTGGPYFNYAVDFSGGLSNYLDKFDWGLGLGAGLDISKIHAGIRYDWGMQNIAKDDGAKLKNNVFSIFVGFFF
ncbi:MAG: porin family protein [Prevotellaceae bacterium]|jgi:hypothetical protein|nr:porin family protein [Prevotellaceae bacterium]